MANETESNNNQSEANQIEFGETVIGNIFGGDKGQDLSFDSFADLFEINNISSLQGSKTSSLNDKYINSEATYSYTSDTYSLGDGYDNSKPDLDRFSEINGDVGIQNYNPQDSIIIPINTGKYRGLSGDDTYVISELINDNSEIEIVDRSGNNTIQIPDNTKIINSKWVQDATILTLSNNSKITIQHADEYDYELGANVMTGDNGTSMTFIELASVFDINIPSNGIAETTDDFYII